MALGKLSGRVFISSTFRDMHAERDHLVRFVFPRLREQLLTSTADSFGKNLRRCLGKYMIMRDVVMDCVPVRCGSGHEGFSDARGRSGL
ncbi:MAG: DUF4062 domain-containing protein [Acidobacteria bacterium]|nr:DUF4062 domain-containing protein [Acidobacteriota bacterium]